jgi:outer membrane protein assembly factor BamB
MNEPQIPITSPRLWPGVVLVALMWATMQIPGFIAPGSFTHFLCMFYAPMVTLLLLLGWWLFASRVPWADRFLCLAVLIVCSTVGTIVADPSIRFPLLFVALPIVLTAWVAWLVVSIPLSWPARRLGLAVVFLVVCGYYTTLRFEGASGSMELELAWRWTPTNEDRFLIEQYQAGQTDVQPDSLVLIAQEGDHLGFRGNQRDGVARGVKIRTNWSEKPPEKLWEQRVGPGWSSFAVVGQRLYTQEQRNENEVVVCYEASTGKQLWAHSNKTRFSEIVAGAGPRATPTFANDSIYALGGNGDLDCLNATTGTLVWTANIATDSGAKIPEWGFSASPLVVDDIVTVYTGSDKKGMAILGYNAKTGERMWMKGTPYHSYCSTQRFTLDGVDQLLVTHGRGMTAHDPKSGEVLWDYEWEPMPGMARVVQPAKVSENEVLLGTGFDQGTRRLKVTKEGSEWKQSEVWTTRKINPYYNDLVIHKGYFYGFDNLFFTCVDLETGESKWRVRGYQHGQVLLLADQELLVIQGEKGDVSLIRATPEGHNVLGKFQALRGKTWNHPVIAHGRLFVRNGEWMACYDVREESGSQP